MAKVLVIDSEAPVAQTLRSALEERGAEVEVTGDGAQGLELARSARPELIVLCVELSRGSGYSVCNKLKKDPDLAAIPLILTSSQATDETFEQHKKLRTRAEEYLKKPYDAAALLGLAGKYVALAGGGAAAAAAPADDEFEVSLDDFSVDVSIDEPAAKTTVMKMPDLSSRPAPVEASVAATLGDVDAELFDLSVETAPEPARPAPVAPRESTPAPVTPAPRPAPAAVSTPVLDDEADGGFGSQSTQMLVTSAQSTQRAISSAESERTRGEMQKLRQRIKELESTIEQKELEFNDRLLEESGRAREAIDLKKKLTLVEREISKHQQEAEKARAEVERMQQEMANVRNSAEGGEQERQVLSDKIGQLVEKVKSLAAERDSLQAELDASRDAHQATERDAEGVAKAREKAKKAVDIAVQLIGETGLVH